MLLFYVGEERYACDCDHVVEVIPRVPLKQVAHAPPYLAGLVRFSSQLVPVLDFAQLRDSRPCANIMSTRIVIVQASGEENNGRRLMGVMGERITETIPLVPGDFSQHNMSFKNAAYLAGVHADDKGVIQMVDIALLFPIVHNVLSGV